MLGVPFTLDHLIRRQMTKRGSQRDVGSDLSPYRDQAGFNIVSAEYIDTGTYQTRDDDRPSTIVWQMTRVIHPAERRRMEVTSGEIEVDR